MLNKYCQKSIWNEFTDSSCAIKVLQDDNSRNENYQNNLKQGSMPVARQSIDTTKHVSIVDDIDDNDSNNSISESLNNYLDMKVYLRY